MRLSIVMPSYNEAKNLPQVVPEVIASCRKACPEGFELVIVNDGSTDDTARVAQELGQAYPELRLLVHERNRGLTAALRTGYFAARGEWVLFVPADGQIPAHEIATFLDASAGQDLVLSEYRHRPDGMRRVLMSRGLRVLLRLLLDLNDRAEGPYLFRRALLEPMALVAERSAGSIGFEIAAKARRARLRVTCVTIDCTARLSGASKVANARNIAQYIGELVRIRRSMRRQVAADR